VAGGDRSPSVTSVVRVLLVEDDATVRQTLARQLTQAGMTVQSAGTGPEALEAYAEQPADVVLLDLMLPGLSGLEVCRRLRGIRPDLPVIMVTARGEEHERVHGLHAGADDYVVKPFSTRELELRIRAVLRRREPAAAPMAAVLADGDLRLDMVARSAIRDGKPLILTAREFDLLAHFLRHPGTVFAREELLERVWGWHIGDASTVTVHVRRVREKVEADPGAPTALVTVFGKGYRWDGLGR